MSDPQKTEAETASELLSMTASIVSSYASHNQMAQSELSELIVSVHSTLSGLSSDGSAQVAGKEEPDAPLVPAVPIDRSVTDDAIICLEDGKPFKTLKRHLRTAYDMSPDEYRAKWGLSKDYPMVAPNYSARRAETAKRIGLGRKPEAAKRKRK